MELGYESTNSVQNLQSIFVMLTLYFFKLAVVLVMKTIHHFTGRMGEKANKMLQEVFF